MECNQHREPWNKGKLVGLKPPLKPKDIWAIRIQLQNAHQVRDLAMFNLAIDSKLRGCDLVNLRVRDITHGNQVLARAMVVQRKTQRPVQFELTEPTRGALTNNGVLSQLHPAEFNCSSFFWIGLPAALEFRARMISGLTRRGALNAVIHGIRRRQSRWHQIRLGISGCKRRCWNRRFRFVLVTAARHQSQSNADRQIVYHFA